MYTRKNYRSKKELKAAVEAWNKSQDVQANAQALLSGGLAAPAVANPTAATAPLPPVPVNNHEGRGTTGV